MTSTVTVRARDSLRREHIPATAITSSSSQSHAGCPKTRLVMSHF